MIEFTAYGTPAPQGSKKFVGTDKAGRGILVESSKKVRPWRMDVKMAAEAARKAHGCTFDGPLVVSMVFTVKKPSSAPKSRQTWPDRMPDLSKLLRSTEDAITDAGLWADDARVVRYGNLAKVYPGEDPDLSKLLRSTEDAITDAGLWADDARVVRYSNLAKVYPGEDPDALASPGVKVRIAHQVARPVSPQGKMVEVAL